MHSQTSSSSDPSKQSGLPSQWLSFKMHWSFEWHWKNSAELFEQMLLHFISSEYSSQLTIPSQRFVAGKQEISPSTLH
jgi:hypothetical protein